MKRALQLLALAAVSGLFALLIAEIAVRGFVTVRNVGPSFTIYDPVFGKRLKADFSTTRVTPEFTMRLTTNSLGFRGPEPPAPPRGAILFLGDSFTMGYGVDDEEEFPALVRQAVAPQGVPVVNAGIGDNGNGRWLKFLEREAPRYAPRLVVLQVTGNDFYDNHDEGLFELSPGGELVELAVPAPGTKRRIQRVIELVPGVAYLHLVGLMRQIRMPAGVRSSPREPSDPESIRQARLVLASLTHRLIEEALSTCAEQGWPTLVVLTDLEDEWRRPLEELLVVRGVPFFSAPRKIERPELYYDVDGHWRPAGHAYMAEKLLENRALRDAVEARNPGV